VRFPARIRTSPASTPGVVTPRVSTALEDTLYLNRAHSEGRLRQTADLLGFALMVNSLMLARHRAREAVRTAA
jgi:hypothetical protein